MVHEPKRHAQIARGRVEHAGKPPFLEKRGRNVEALVRHAQRAAPRPRRLRVRRSQPGVCALRIQPRRALPAGQLVAVVHREQVDGRLGKPLGRKAPEAEVPARQIEDAQRARAGAPVRKRTLQHVRPPAPRRLARGRERRGVRAVKRAGDVAERMSGVGCDGHGGYSSAPAALRAARGTLACRRTARTSLLRKPPPPWKMHCSTYSKPSGAQARLTRSPSMCSCARATARSPRGSAHAPKSTSSPSTRKRSAATPRAGNPGASTRRSSATWCAPCG